MSKIDLILDELREIKQTQTAHGEKLYEMHGTVSGLKVRSSIFGVVGGFLAAILSLVLGRGHA